MGAARRGSATPAPEESSRAAAARAAESEYSDELSAMNAVMEKTIRVSSLAA